MYLPLAGLTVLASVALASLLRGSGRCNGERSDVRRGAYRSVAAALVVALATATHARNAVFESAEIVWRDVLRSRPGNLRAQAALNCEMLRQARWAEAEEGARRLLDESRSSLSSGEIPFTQAAADPRRYYVAAHSQLGLVMLARGRPDAALPHFTEAIRSDRSGAALQYYWRATAYRAKGDVRSAVQDLLEAVRLEPGMERAQEALGEALAAQGLYAEAIQRFDRALAANPDQASSALELAWLLATAPDNALRDGERAVRLARAVDAKTGGSSMRALEVLAAGLAETGRYGEATGTARQALGLARSRKGAPAGPDDGAESYLLPAPAPDRLRQIEAAMRLYESGRPLRLSAGGAAAGEGNG
jgi:tetratricopeptide (TPR) repeat protein